MVTEKTAPAGVEERIPNYESLFESSGGTKKSGLSILLGGFRLYRGRILLSVVAYVIKHSPTWVLPVVTAEIINIASRPADESTYSSIAMYAVVLALILIQNIPTNMWWARLTNTVLRGFGAGVRCALVRKLQQLSLTYHKQIESGRLQSKFLRDIESVNALASTVLLTVMQALIGVVVAVGISLYHSVTMTLFFVAIVPLNIVVTRLFRRKIAVKFREYRIVNENVSASFTSMLKMLPITKAHGLENRELSDFDHEVNQLTKTGLSADGTSACFGACVWVLSNVLSCACLILCAVLALKGQIEVGDIVLYQSLFSQINGSVSALVNVFPTLISGLEAISSISEVMNSDEVEKDGTLLLFRFSFR